MPRSQANLKLTVMQGLRGLSLEAKLLYFELLVEPSLSPCGVGVYRLDWWAQETELDVDRAAEAMAELEDGRYAFADPAAGEVLVRTLIRRDGIAEKPNMLWSACRAAELIRSVKLRRVVAEELRKLPPKPPPTLGKNGRLYEHPDPHATAAQIDPPSDPHDPTGEPIGNHSTTVPEPSESNGSGTYREPIAAEPFENHSRTPGGGGGGGGRSSCPVGGPVGGSRAHAREGPTPHDPPCEKPCHRCQAARLAAEAEAAEALARERRRRAANVTVRDQCALCDEAGWLLADDGTPVEPARRCDHRPLRAVS